MGTQADRRFIRLIAVVSVFAGVVGVSVKLVGTIGAMQISHEVFPGSDIVSITLY